MISDDEDADEEFKSNIAKKQNHGESMNESFHGAIKPPTLGSSSLQSHSHIKKSNKSVANNVFMPKFGIPSPASEQMNMFNMKGKKT